MWPIAPAGAWLLESCRRPPPEAHFVSYSAIDSRHASDSVIAAPVHRLTTIMQMLGHKKIDLLKMDIEGSEYAVIADLIASAVPVEQLLVEFHHRRPEVGMGRTRAAIENLHRAGYRLFDVSWSGEEYSFWRTTTYDLVGAPKTGAACERPAALSSNSPPKHAGGADE